MTMRLSCRVAALLLILLVVGSCATDVRMKPLRPVVLSGVIRDPEGRGIPEARVALTLDQGQFSFQAPYNIETDANGQFQARVAEGDYVPVVYTEVLSRITLPTLHVRAPSTRLDYTYAAFRVSGSVTGHGGVPVDSGRVDIHTINAITYDDYVDTYITFRGGQYKTFLPIGQYSIQFVPYTDGLPSKRYVPISVAADTTLDVLLDGHAITGSVTLDGAPLAVALVQASSQEISAHTHSDATGAYTLYLPTGDYDWYVETWPNPLNVYPLSQSGPNVGGPATLNFDMSGVDWTGTVRAGSGLDPVPGANVFVNLGATRAPVQSTTDATGAFHLIVRPSRRYRISVTAPGIGNTEILGVLAGNDSTFDILLQPPSP